MLALSVITVLLIILTSLVILFKKPGRFSNAAFSISLFFTACVIAGDTLSVIQPDSYIAWKQFVFICEAIMAPSWLLFTLSFAKTDFRKTMGLVSKLLLFLFPLLAVFLLLLPHKLFFYSPEFESEKILFLGNAGFIFNLLILLFSVWSIINLEATLKSSSGTARWQIKYALIGIGGIFAVNIFYYSHALLYRSINMNLLPVRTGVVLISVILILFSLLRHRFMEVEVTISRRIFFRSMSLIIVGLYLLGLGLIGEGMRYLDPKIGKNIAVFLGFAGAMGVLVLILSEQLRKKTQVFINKNFYSQKYDYRSQWLQFTHRISSKYSFDELLLSIVEGFKDALGVRGASLWLRRKGNGGYYCVKNVDAASAEAEPGQDIISFLFDSGWVFDVNNKNCRTVADQNLEFIEKNKASLIVPLMDKNNLAGFVILRENLAGNDYNYEDYDLLKALARQATSAIMNARLTEELAESREIEAMGRLSSFIMHDLKNATSVLSLLTENAERHIDNPEFQKDAIKSISGTAVTMKELMQKLRNFPSRINMNFEYGDIGTLVKEVITDLNFNGPAILGENSMLTFKEIEPVKTIIDRNEIKKVILNLVINAIDATGEQGKIDITVGRHDNSGFIKISDNGVGMQNEFIETALFKPFKTTKSKGLGVGLYQCKTIVDSHSGKIKVKSKVGEGAEFTVYLPISNLLLESSLPVRLAGLRPEKKI